MCRHVESSLLRFFLAVAAVLATLAVPMGCGRAATPPAPLTPDALAGRARTNLIEGAAAQNAVGHLHGKSVAPVDSAVAEYDGGALVLYVSRYADEAGARAAFDAMLTAMRAGRGPFAVPTPWPGREGAWFTTGLGAHHALWRSDRAVCWLQGDPALVSRGASELWGAPRAP